MDNEKIIKVLEDIHEILKDPLYRPLEVGFRHSDLTLKEVVERYKESLLDAKHSIEWLLNEMEYKKDV